MSDKPTIAVVIPVYNGALYIAEALESVFAQTLPATEVFVIDDASTDSTPEILQSYGDRIRVLRNEKNVGQGASRNRGVRATISPYIAFLDADDYWAPLHLEQLYNVLNLEPSVSVVFCRMANVGIKKSIWPETRHLAEWGEPIDVFLPLMREQFIMPSASLIRRSLHEELGGFDETRPFGSEDSDYYCRAAVHHLFVGLLEPTIFYRWHMGQNCKRNWVPRVIKYFEYRASLLAEVSRRRMRSKSDYVQAEVNSITQWQHYMERAWCERNILGMRRLLWHSLFHGLFSQSDYRYVLRALIPQCFFSRNPHGLIKD